MASRIFEITHVPIDINRADMLPAIVKEIEIFLRGENPFQPTMLADGRVILHCYLPGLWLSYLPFHILGIDLRYLNIIAQLFFYLALTDCFVRRPKMSSILFLILVAFHLFSKQQFRQVVDIHTAPFALAYSLFIWSVIREKKRWGYFLIPFIILCREPAAVLFIPFGIYLWRFERAQFVATVKWGLLFGSAIALPFIFKSPEGFFHGAFFYARHIYETPYDIATRFYGLSGILRLTHLEWLQQPLQLTGLAFGVWLACTRKKMDALSALALGAMAYVCIMLFASITYQYVYNEPLILVYFLIACSGCYKRTQPPVASN